MIMKFSISSIAAAMLCSTAALAADLPSRMPPPPVPSVPVFTWTGLYVGANVGYGGDRFVYPINGFVAPIAVAAGSASITSGGVLGGGQIGYNWQFPNNVLLGFETDFDGATIRGKVTANAGAGILGIPIVAAASVGSKINYIGTVRGRVGYAWDRFLVYGTGGFAYGQVNFTANALIGAGGIGAAAISTSQNSGRTGWTAGGGFEYAVTNNVTVKTEYLYVNLGTNTLLNGIGINIRQKTTANIVRAGLNYKFDWFAPLPAVVAKY